MIQRSVRILGIDPGLRYTGWGVIDCTANRIHFVDSGVVTSAASAALADRLLSIHQGLSAVLDRLKPCEAAVEKSFVGKGAASTLKLGYARGISLLVPAQEGIRVAEYAPNVVKKSVVGVGHAEKQQVQRMVAMLLPGAKCVTEHAADALAVAITHAHLRGSSLPDPQ